MISIVGRHFLFLDCAWGWLVWYCADSRKVVMQPMVSSGIMSGWKKAAIGTLCDNKDGESAFIC